MIYKLPLHRHSTSLSNGMWGKCQCMQVDKMGLFVYYQNKEDLTVTNIRRHLIGGQSITGVIVADSPKEALNKFFREFTGAKVGGPKFNQKALYIEPNKTIIEYPDCPLLREKENGDIKCGEPWDGEDYQCDCVLNGGEAPLALDGCIVQRIDGEIYKRKNDIDSFRPTRYSLITRKMPDHLNRDFYEQTINGFKFLRPHYLIKEDTDPQIELFPENVGVL